MSLLKNILFGLVVLSALGAGLALVGVLVVLAVKVCLFLFVLFCKIVIPFVAGVVVVAFAGLVLWAVGVAVMGIVKAVRSRG